MKDSCAAFNWIIDQLEQRKIPYALVGGMAANAYGTSRPLNDIDIDVPDAVLKVLAKELHEHVAFGPEHSVSECFDCQLLGFKYLSQEIELSGADSIRIKDIQSGEWLHWPTDLNAVEYRKVFDRHVPVMKRAHLIAYKKLAGRDTDLMDVRELEITSIVV